MTNILIDGIKPQTAKNGRIYFSFWVRILIDHLMLSVSGWKYYPDTKSVSSPSTLKGKDRFIETCKLNGAFYEVIVNKVRTMMDGEEEKAA